MFFDDVPMDDGMGGDGGMTDAPKPAGDDEAGEKEGGESTEEAV